LRVQVPTFADPRLAALLEQRREAELLQCALRGRPFDHPDVQVTLLFSLPLPGLPPTVIVEASTSPASNGGRERAAKARLCAAAQQLLDRGKRVLEVGELAAAAQTSVGTTRRHVAHVAARLHLRLLTRRRVVSMPRGGVRHYERLVLLRRGRVVPERAAQQPSEQTERDHFFSEGPVSVGPTMMDQARKKRSIARSTHHHVITRRRRAALALRQRSRPRSPPACGR